MSKAEFVYVTTIDKLWQALTAGEITRRYWFGIKARSSYERGTPWRLVAPDGRVFDSGEVLESDPPRHLAISWRHELDPALRAEGLSRASYSLEANGDMVKSTVVHSSDASPSKLVEAVSQGWPLVLSSLKSLMETGQSLEQTR